MLLSSTRGHFHDGIFFASRACNGHGAFGGVDLTRHDE
jgi:hypothetical protein